MEENNICGKCKKPKGNTEESCNCGRPTEYSQELAEKICRQIAEGKSVRHIVNNEEMPSSSTIYRWLLDEEKKEFWEQYEKARNIQAEQMFEELLDIADDGTNDFYTRSFNGEEKEIPDVEHISRSRLRVDTRKWYLSKVLPKKFGEKLDMTTNGKDLPTPIAVVNRENNG